MVYLQILFLSQHNIFANTDNEVQYHQEKFPPQFQVPSNKVAA